MVDTSKMLGGGGQFRHANKMGLSGIKDMRLVAAMMRKHNMTAFGDLRRDADQVKRFLDGGNLHTDPTDPKPKGTFTNSTDAFNPSQGAIQQNFAGVDPNDESQFFTEGQNFVDANRIGNAPGYTGINQEVTREDFQGYNTAREAFNNQEVTFNEDGTVSETGESPLAQYDGGVFDNPVNRRNFEAAFADENLNSLQFTQGQFNQVEGGPQVLNETDGRQFSGISRLNRARDFIADPGEAQGISGVPQVGNDLGPAPINIQPGVQQEAPVQQQVTNNPRANPGSFGISRRQKQLSRENKRRLNGKRGRRIGADGLKFNEGGKFKIKGGSSNQVSAADVFNVANQF